MDTSISSMNKNLKANLRQTPNFIKIDYEPY